MMFMKIESLNMYLYYILYICEYIDLNRVINILNNTKKSRLKFYEISGET